MKDLTQEPEESLLEEYYIDDEFRAESRKCDSVKQLKSCVFSRYECTPEQLSVLLSSTAILEWEG